MNLHRIACRSGVIVGSAALIVALAGASGHAASGEAQRLIPYSGTLERLDAPIPSTVALSFFAYAEASGDEQAVWSEDHVDVPVTAGRFGVKLGSNTEIPTALLKHGRFYLEVAVNGILLEGRQIVSTTPFALHAEHAANGVPVGAVGTFFGTRAPTGWLICDGAQIDRVDRPELEALVNHLRDIEMMGSDAFRGDTETSARLPDLRGRFLRGQDRGAGVNPDAEGNDGLVGAVQGDSTKVPNSRFAIGTEPNHSHPGVPDHVHNASISRGAKAGPGNSKGYLVHSGTTTNGAGGHAHGESGRHAHELTGGDAETRPKNVTVLYIIKY
jgi:microcystin-dependent protein